MKNDFSVGSIPKHILNIAIPMTVAQLIHVLYNIVDRIFIGRMPGNATLAMSGLGLCLPLILLITAFANLFGMGGAPLSSIERGKGNIDKAEHIMGNSFAMILYSGIVIMIIGFLFKRNLLFLFGASSETIAYADGYMTIYLLGTLPCMLGLGLNSYINAQGFSKVGMMTVTIGAVVNLILDPVFIFWLKMGVQGAALATVLSQVVSAIWTLQFLLGNQTILKIKKECMKLDFEILGRIISLGTASFMMALTNSLVSIVCNKTLQTYGGDTYIAIMTIINSIREVAMLASQGVSSGLQPVIGFNYGAGKKDRILQSIKFSSILAFFLMLGTWILIIIFDKQIIGIFSTNQDVLALGPRCVRLYFFGFFMMTGQLIGQSVALGLGKSKQAIFFSLFRKAFIVAPLTIILPMFIGIDGVFAAEAISNYIGGGACFITMLFTIVKELKR